jgi:2,3-bisphosphoglycerate-independent phosphoglycerate mutase
MVGARGLEPPTSASRTLRATKLRYAPQLFYYRLKLLLISKGKQLKYCVLIMDGSAGLPIPERGGKTSLELARTPNLDALAAAGTVGLGHNVPPDLDPDSAVACMSIFGYDPKVYYTGRAPIEAKSLGIDFKPGEVVFRCNPVTIQNGIMVSHSAGSISTEEGHLLMAALNESSWGATKFTFTPASATAIF